VVTQLRVENEKLSGEVKRASEVNSDMKAVIGKLEAAATRDVSQKTFFSTSLTHRQDDIDCRTARPQQELSA
jgi:hypothetical protein